VRADGLGDVEQLARVAEEAAEAGAEVALAWWKRRDDLTVGYKDGPDDLVSEADQLTESAIQEILRMARPADAIRGEEGSAVSGDSGLLWLVDPIDGTTSFLYGREDWAVSVAAVDRASGTVVAGAVCEAASRRMTVAGRGLGTWFNGKRCPQLIPKDHARALVEVNLGRPDQRQFAGRMVGELTLHVRDLRRSGSAAAGLAALATGRADAVWAPGLQPWDGAAGLLLAAECGARVGDLAGSSDGRWPPGGDVLAAEPGLFEALRRWLSPVYESGTPPADPRPEQATLITPYPDGPLIIRGTFEVCDIAGVPIEHSGGSVALCRCGRSATKPFCDGRHKSTRRRPT
jgi:myo-inositol-1(or 4)-monophosphatase